LPKKTSPEQIIIYGQLRSFTPEKHNKYLQKEKDIYFSCGILDFNKRNDMISTLQKEYGIEAGNETPSRSYHP
jgi:hypothetical protein